MDSPQQRWNSWRILRNSSGSSRADKEVEPTRSQKSTVTWRRSAPSVADGVDRGSTDRLGTCNELQAACTALISFLRCPRETPSFSKSCSVSSGKISQSMSFSANKSAYCASPIFSSQSCRSVILAHNPNASGGRAKPAYGGTATPRKEPYPAREYSCRQAILFPKRPDDIAIQANTSTSIGNVNGLTSRRPSPRIIYMLT